MTPKQKKAYKEGYDACSNRKSRASCPYGILSPILKFYWLMGYDDCVTEIGEKQ